MVLMLLPEKLDRTPSYWWQLRQPPTCPNCGVACHVYSTRRSPDGGKIQYRKCPRCGHRTKNHVRA